MRQKRINTSELSPGSYYENMRQTKIVTSFAPIDEPVKVFEPNSMIYKSNGSDEWLQRNKSITVFDRQRDEDEKGY